LISIKHSPILAEILYQCFDIGNDITEDLYDEFADILAIAANNLNT